MKSNTQRLQDYCQEPQLPTHQSIAYQLRKNSKMQLIQSLRIITVPQPSDIQLQAKSIFAPEEKGNVEICKAIVQKLTTEESEETKTLQVGLAYLNDRVCNEDEANKQLIDENIEHNHFISYLNDHIRTWSTENKINALCIINVHITIGFSQAMDVANLKIHLYAIELLNCTCDSGLKSQCYSLLSNLCGSSETVRNELLCDDLLSIILKELSATETSCMAVYDVLYLILSVFHWEVMPTIDKLAQIVKDVSTIFLSCKEPILLLILLNIFFKISLDQTYYSHIRNEYVIFKMRECITYDNEEMQIAALKCISTICSISTDDVKLCLQTDILKLIIKCLNQTISQELQLQACFSLSNITPEPMFTGYIISEGVYKALSEGATNFSQPVLIQALIAMANGFIENYDQISESLNLYQTISLIIQSVSSQSTDLQYKMALMDCVLKLNTNTKFKEQFIALKGIEAIEAIASDSKNNSEIADYASIIQEHYSYREEIIN